MHSQGESAEELHGFRRSAEFLDGADRPVALGVPEEPQALPMPGGEGLGGRLAHPSPVLIPEAFREGPEDFRSGRRLAHLP